MADPFLLLVVMTLTPRAEADRAENRIEIPGSTLALDDGTTSVPTNPALFGFDPDPSASLLYRTGILDPSVSFQGSTSAGGLGLGVFYDGAPDEGSFWALSTSLSIRLAESVSMGSTVRWNIPEGDGNNFTSWDLGLGWRPLYWLGFGAAARNIGNPDPGWGASGRYGVGAAVRPFGDSLSIAYDHLFQDPFVDTAGVYNDRSQINQLTLRSEPIDGLVLRAYATDEIAIGGGLEFYFGKSGVGVYGTGTPSMSSPALTAGMLTTSPEKRLFGGGKRVPEFKISDPYPYTPRASFFAPKPEGYLHLLRRLHEAASDRSVKGVLVHLDATPFNLAQIEEIRGLLLDIRASGRPVVVYLDQEVDNAAYLLATAADKIYMHPAATLDLVGLSVEMQYLRGTLDMIGIEAQYAARSEYKSAIEPLTRTSPSAASVEQTNALLDDLSGVLVKGISEGRAKSQQDVQTLIDGGPYTAAEAKQNGLVDATAYPDELEKELEGIFPKDFHTDGEYLASIGTKGWTNPRRIAVVVVAGGINSGPSEGPGLFGGEESAGSETIVKALEQAADDHTVKAVVLRVDSPGGSAFASDEIWRAIEEVKKEKKPVVVTMGGYAASGGYYVSSGADTILAEPSTITGSIGVFGGKINAEGLFDKIGIESYAFTRGRKAGMWSISRPLDPTEMDALDHLIGDTYTQFKGKVSAGRKLTDDQVEQVARGRVWSGIAAQGKGLVDRAGGFYDAVDAAREAAKLSENARFDLITYSPDADVLGNLPWEFVRAAVGTPKTPASLKLLHRMGALEDEHVFMALPYELEVR